eukprot:gene7525-11849_t
MSGKAKKVGKYELCETIGRGTFSKVKRGINTETGEVVAIKIINITSLQKEGMEKQMKREISVLKSIQHENVVTMIEVLKSSNHFYIVMELITGGELFDKIVSVKKFDEKVARRYFQQLIDGLSYCHKKGIAHRDLKPENLLLGKNDTLKISDFGLSGLAGDNKMLSTICGTPHYVAPEVLSGSYDGISADVWSLGIILFVMLSGCHPFDGDSVAELFNRIENLEFKYPNYFTKGARALLDKIIVVDPKKRATMEDIKNDPWFKKGYKGDTGARKSIKLNVDDLNTIEEASVEFEKENMRNVRLSIRMQHSEPLNAFEIITQIAMKGRMNPLANKGKSKTSAPSVSYNFAYQGLADEIYEEMISFLQSAKCETKTKDTSYWVKCRLKGINDVEFSTHVSPINNFLSICEFVKIRGNTLKFQELFRSTKQKYAIKTEDIVDNTDETNKKEVIMQKTESEEKIEEKIEEKKEETKEEVKEEAPKEEIKEEEKLEQD